MKRNQYSGEPVLQYLLLPNGKKQYCVTFEKKVKK
jgi:hypothetical protein